MRNSLLKVGIFTVMLILLTPAHTNAGAAKSTAFKNAPLDFSIEQTVADFDNTEDDKPQEEEAAKETTVATAEATLPAAPAPPTPVTYTVVAGDNLSKIANLYQTTWPRLYAKNTHIAHPDTIQAGDAITIPLAEEQLTERVLPTPQIPITTPTTQAGTVAQPAAQAIRPTSAGGSAGNTYAAGYCTWYAKSRRPDLPNRMGNAISWVASARASGFATGGTPQAGAIGQQGNHVVYVESVNGDGTVTISEMNYRGLGVISTRTAPAGNFTYIY